MQRKRKDTLTNMLLTERARSFHGRLSREPGLSSMSTDSWFIHLRAHGLSKADEHLILFLLSLNEMFGDNWQQAVDVPRLTQQTVSKL